jgi:hypothetical protein
MPFAANLAMLLVTSSLLTTPIVLSQQTLPLKQHFSPQTLSTQTLSAQPASNKITFDLSRLDTSSNQAGSIMYEFCIPVGESYLAEVRSIDPTIRYLPDSRGRIGCRSDQALCLGRARGAQGRDLLLAIANLSYVERIDEFFGE